MDSGIKSIYNSRLLLAKKTSKATKQNSQSVILPTISKHKTQQSSLLPKRLHKTPACIIKTMTTFNLKNQHKQQKQPITILQKDHFEFLSVIGEGNYAKVYMARFIQSSFGKITKNQIVALKSIRKIQVDSKQKGQFLLNEAKILQKIQHPFLIKHYGKFQDEKRIYFVLEYCPGGELLTIIKKVKLTQSMIKFFAVSIIIAVSYLHKKNIIYRDLKPQNILVDKKGYLRLTDFGLSKTISPNEKLYEICGTPEYLAPQVILKQGYSFSLDWWGLGCLIHQLFCGTPPFKQQNTFELFQSIIHNDYIPPKKASIHLQDFLKKLLSKDPQKRLGTKELQILKHNWLKDINVDEIRKMRFKPQFTPSIGHQQDVCNFSEQFTLMSISSNKGLPSMEQTILANQKYFNQVFKSQDYVIEDL